ncbi:MAG: hypothetical protein M1823_006610, partial [Watsoniomyces obsoletus]
MAAARPKSPFRARALLRRCHRQARRPTWFTLRIGTRRLRGRSGSRPARIGPFWYWPPAACSPSPGARFCCGRPRPASCGSSV